VVVEQAEAPVQGGPHRPVPVVDSWSAGQQPQPVGHPGLQAVEPEGRQARSRQLDRQGVPVELAADRRDPASIVRVRRRPAGHGGPLDEQRHRVVVATVVPT
jgi:hypothetical protein